MADKKLIRDEEPLSCIVIVFLVVCFVISFWAAGSLLQSAKDDFMELKERVKAIEDRLDPLPQVNR